MNMENASFSKGCHNLYTEGYLGVIIIVGSS
jgi:hypothetical protein